MQQRKQLIWGGFVQSNHYMTYSTTKRARQDMIELALPGSVDGVLGCMQWCSFGHRTAMANALYY